MNREDVFKELEETMISYFNVYNNEISFVWWLGNNVRSREPSFETIGHEGEFHQLFYNSEYDIGLWVNNESRRFYVYIDNNRELGCLRTILDRLQRRVGSYSF